MYFDIASVDRNQAALHRIETEKMGIGLEA